MKLLRMIKQDLLYGTFKQIMLFLFLIIMVLVCLNGWYEYVVSLKRYGLTDGIGTFADYYLFTLKGEDIYEVSWNSKFQVPIYWMGINLFIALSVGGYFSEDLTGYGRMKILYGGSRERWVLSKLIWITAHVLFCYGMICITTVSFCIMKGIPLSFHLSEAIWESTMPAVLNLSMTQLIEIVVVLPFFSTLVISIVQNGFAVFFQPHTGYIFACGILMASAYWTKPLLIGNYIMWGRSRLLHEKGVGLFNGIILLSVIGVAMLFILIRYMQRCDILNKKENI